MPLALRQLVEGVNGLARIDGPCRVVGRDQDDGARLRADQLGGILGRGHRAGAGPEVERHRLDALHAQPHVVIEIVGAGQDHLVARLGDAHQRQAEGLVAARGDADLAGGDRRAVEAREVGGVVLAQRRQAEDRRVAVHRRIEQQFAEMAAQLDGRRVAGHRLAEIDQWPVGGKGAVQHPALGLADRRGLDGGEPGIGRRNLLHLAQPACAMHSAATLRGTPIQPLAAAPPLFQIDFTVFSRTKFPPGGGRCRSAAGSIRVRSGAVKPVCSERPYSRKCIA